MRLKLNHVNVTFNPEGHVYEFNGNILTSVTTIIKHHVFPDLYGGVDKALLAEKAAYGTMVHEAIESYEMGFLTETDNADVQAYIDYARHSGNTVRQTEYLVSDLVVNAGKIDQVLTNGDEIYLADIKTTSVLNMEYLSVQLSLYAYDFELMNPGLKVSKLLAIHIKDGKCKQVDVQRLPSEYIEALLEAEHTGETFIDPLKTPCDDAEKIIARIRQLELDMVDYKAFMKPKEDEIKILKEQLYDLARAMDQNGFDCESGLVKVGNDTVTERFSMDTLSAAAPAFFKRYHKSLLKGFSKSILKGRVIIKFK